MKTLPPISVITHPISPGTQSGVGSKSKAGPDPAVFAQGQTLRAVVVAENAGDNYTLEARGSRFVVQSRAPLSPGQSLNLQVMSTDPQIELMITEDATSRFFSRSLAPGSNQELTSFFTLLRQLAPSLPSPANGLSLQALQQFGLLQQQTGREVSSAQPDTTGQAMSPGQYGPKVLQHIFAQLGAKIENLFVEGKDQAVPATIEAALQDIAHLFQGKSQLSRAALRQLDQLPPSTKTIFEILTSLQQGGNPGQLQLPQQPPLSAANSVNTLNALKAGLTELLFLLKGPESLLQLFTTGNLQNSLLTQAQAKAILSSHGAGEDGKKKSGELLQQLVAKLGLNLEGMLAAGNRGDAVKTVKFALMELVQNLTEQSRLVESGKRALSTLESFQLTQLQTARQDILVMPLPLPYLEQGYLVIEDYRDQTGGGEKDREMPKHFSLLLKLSPLGNLKIDFLLSGEGVYLRFNSESKAASEFLATFKDDLNDAITDTLIHGVSFSESGEDPLAVLLRRSRVGADSLINTKA